MSETQRERILARLRNAPRQELPRPPSVPPSTEPPAAGERAARLKSRMEAMRAEVHLIPSETWIDRLKEILAVRSVATLLYAPQTAIGEALQHAWETDAAGPPELVAYAGPVETFKERLFAVEAAVTTAAGAVADTGAILWADGRRASADLPGAADSHRGAGGGRYLRLAGRRHRRRKRAERDRRRTSCRFRPVENRRHRADFDLRGPRPEGAGGADRGVKQGPSRRRRSGSREKLWGFFSFG